MPPPLLGGRMENQKPVTITPYDLRFALRLVGDHFGGDAARTVCRRRFKNVRAGRPINVALGWVDSPVGSRTVSLRRAVTSVFGRGFPLPAFGVLQPVAFALGLDDLATVCESVQGRSREPFVNDLAGLGRLLSRLRHGLRCCRRVLARRLDLFLIGDGRLTFGRFDGFGFLHLGFVATAAEPANAEHCDNAKDKKALHGQISKRIDGLGFVDFQQRP